MSGPSEKFIEWVRRYGQEPDKFVFDERRFPGAKRLAADLNVTHQCVLQWLKPHGKCRPVPAPPKRELAKKMVSLSKGYLTLEDIYGEAA